MSPLQTIFTDDLVLFSMLVLCKYPISINSDEGNSNVAWHQDLKYWYVSPLEGATVWIAIDDTDGENGGMIFLPGTCCWSLSI